MSTTSAVSAELAEKCGAAYRIRMGGNPLRYSNRALVAPARVVHPDERRQKRCGNKLA
jgi:hypothetical protein